MFTFRVNLFGGRSFITSRKKLNFRPLGVKTLDGNFYQFAGFLRKNPEPPPLSPTYD